MQIWKSCAVSKQPDVTFGQVADEAVVVKAATKVLRQSPPPEEPKAVEKEVAPPVQGTFAWPGRLDLWHLEFGFSNRLETAVMKPICA